MRWFLVDKVTELVVGERIVGLKAVTLSDPILHDHFPDHPILPGALVVEAGAQLAGLLLELSFDEGGDEPPRRAILTQIERAKFHRAAGPADVLRLEAILNSRLTASARVSVRATIAGVKAATATLVFSMQTVASERVHAQRRQLYTLWTRDLDPSTFTLR